MYHAIFLINAEIGLQKAKPQIGSCTLITMKKYIVMFQVVLGHWASKDTQMGAMAVWSERSMMMMTFITQGGEGRGKTN